MKSSKVNANHARKYPRGKSASESVPTKKEMIEFIVHGTDERVFTHLYQQFFWREQLEAHFRESLERVNDEWFLKGMFKFAKEVNRVFAMEGGEKHESE